MHLILEAGDIKISILASDYKAITIAAAYFMNFNIDAIFMNGVEVQQAQIIHMIANGGKYYEICSKSY
ncbi:MAG: hypothetical protein PHQ24_11280 [Proteiniphilum sp.]|nr:hypothetical protein [Proteiniphilum sp.]